MFYILNVYVRVEYYVISIPKQRSCVYDERYEGASIEYD